MAEIEGTIVSMGYENEERKQYNLVLDTEYGQRVIIVPLYDGAYKTTVHGGTNIDYLIGLEKIIHKGDKVAFRTRDPEQAVHFKMADEIIIKKKETKQEEKKYN